jgi:hypothetical protein
MRADTRTISIRARPDIVVDFLGDPRNLPRRVLEAFTTSFCGLVSEKAPCRCDRRVARAEQLGRIERGRPRLTRGPVREAQREMQSLHETARLMRSHPDYAAPADVLEGVRAALGGGRSRVLG